jgi:hypothetical protein
MGDSWCMADHEQYFIVERLVRHSGASVIPAFFRRSEEQLIAFLTQAPAAISELGHSDSFSCMNDLMRIPYPELDIPEGTISTPAQIFEFDAQVTIRDHINICWHEIRDLSE